MTQRESQVKVLTIKHFAQICHTTARTLRFYENLGLISPAYIDPFTKYRSYLPEQAREFLQIKLLQNFQMPLKKVQLTITKHAMKETVAKQLLAIKKQIEEKQKEYTFLQTMQDFLFEKPSIKKYFKKEVVEPFSLFSLHISKGDYDKVSEYLEQTRHTAKKFGLHEQKDQFLFYGGTVYQPKSSMLDVAIAVEQTDKQIRFPNGYTYKNFPKTHAYVFTYTGPYEFLTLIYPKLYDFLEEKGISLSGQVFDWYKETPQTVASPFEYVTKLVFPIA